MNMFQLQERIKDFSKDQLVREMQQPSGAVPPFLVLSELQRRTRMEKAFQAEQAQGQQSTVAQDAIAAAGVPQGGIADMAQALAPQTDMTGNTGAMPVQNMYEGGEVKRMQPGGEVDGPATAAQRAEAARIALEEARARRRELLSDEELAAAAARGRARQGLGLSEVSADVGNFMPGALSAPAIGADAGPLSRIDANVAAPRTAPGLPSIRPTDAQPILNETAPPAFRDIAAPATILGPEQGPNLPSMEDAARMIELNRTPAMRAPSQEDLDLRFLESQRELAAEMAAGAGQTPDPTSIIMSDGVMGPIDDRPTPTADAFRAELAGRDARAAEAARMMAINELPEPADPSLMDRLVNSELGRTLAAGSGVALPQMGAEPIDPMQGPNMPLDPVDPSEFGGLPDFMTDPGAYRGEPYTRVADLFGLGPAFDAIPREPDALPMDTGTPLTVPEEADGGIESLLAPAAAPAAGRSGGTGGTGGGAGGRAAGAADADKWLALAQFGLGLMASQQPTLGGAIGEAGTAALSQLRESQKEAYERDLAERTLAARSSGSSRGALTANQALGALNDRIQATNLAMTMATTPEERMRLSDQLALLESQAARILSSSGFGPATAAAEDAGVDLDLAG